MRSKKGESISMSVIIIAAIALLVLLVIAVLVMNSTNQVWKGTSCAGQGKCAAECNPDTEKANAALSGKSGGCNEGELCCVTVRPE